MLLVGDKGFIRTMVARRLDEAGFEVVEAQDGDEVVRLLDGIARCDALFTDVRMPGTRDGLDVAIQARTRWLGLPVLVVSGYVDYRGEYFPMLKPVAMFLCKP